MNRTGAVIVMGAFAALWWIVGVTAPGHASVALRGIPVLITALLLVAALRRRAVGQRLPPGEGGRRGRLIGITSAVEGLLILLAVNVLTNIGKRDFTAPTVAILVGLHSLPLARGLPARVYYATSGLLIGVGTAGCFVPDSNRLLLAVCLGAACVLWLTCAGVLGWAEAERLPG
jgi:hypothetical protein